MKYVNVTATVLFIICVPLLLLTSGVALALNSAWLYEAGFEKYGVSRVTGIGQSELDKAARSLIDYFNSGHSDEFVTFPRLVVIFGKYDPGRSGYYMNSPTG